jgi:hypothetical protein
MIGIFFLCVIGLWLALCLYFALRIPKWFGWTRFRYASIVLLSILFVAPVADEIIAYPQMAALCAASEKAHLTMSEKSAYGRTVYYFTRQSTDTLWPRSVLILHHRSGYMDASTHEEVLVSTWASPVRGLLGVPAGSSGAKTTVLLRTCKTPEDSIALHPGGVLAALAHLKWTVVPGP